MQKIRIVAVGKLKESFWREAVAEYVKRLSRFAAVEVKELAERATIEEEAKEILAACRGYVIALAVGGEKLSSEGFAALVKKLTDEGKEITFLIGSSCGLAAEVSSDEAAFAEFLQTHCPQTDRETVQHLLDAVQAAQFAPDPCTAETAQEIQTLCRKLRKKLCRRTV